MMRVVAVTALDKDGSITEALGKNLSSNIEEVDPLANVATNILDR